VAFTEAARTGTIETRRSWLVAWSALGILCISLGAPLITVVALKPIAAEFGNIRSVPSLAYSLAWLGSAAGGIAMGLVAERVGVRWTVIFGAMMIAAGLVLSSLGDRIALYLGHGLFIGFLGNAGINAPLYVYVARWFDRRRGTALALIASGQAAGWRYTMQIYAALAIVLIIPVAFLIFRQLPRAASHLEGRHEPAAAAAVFGLRPNTAFALLCLASFLCCVPMAMPQGHLVAFCNDLGITVARGSAMLSVMLAFGFMGRQLWGFIADRIGGLRTVLAGSACQIVTMSGFLLTQDEAGLFAVAATFGLGFSGIIPAYVLALRELYPASEASWRVPSLLLCSGSGMAAGGWLAGAIYDYAGFYAAAFAAGIIANLANLAIIGALAFRQSRFSAIVLAP